MPGQKVAVCQRRFEAFRPPSDAPGNDTEPGFVERMMA